MSGRRGEPRARLPSCVVAAGTVLAACTSTAESRPQLIVVIDTDAPVVGQLGDGSGWSPAVAVDTVRVDVIKDDRDVLDYRDITVPDPRDWPFSLGIASQPGTSRIVRLRVRAFRAVLASRGVLNETTTIEPPENALIDRIVDVEQPERGLRTVRVVLATACFGAPASFQMPARTCVDGSRREGHPGDGLTEPAAASLVGTAPEGRERPCAHDPPEGARCIPGGASILGDRHVNGTAVEALPTVPLRPVLVSPFHLDATEFTVGRYRKLVEGGRALELPWPRDASNVTLKHCTWTSATDATTDAYPLNCISYEAAARACEAVGGSLPTEAQWEHAARGRGRGFVYPWGDASPQCCSASASRVALSSIPADCGPGEGVEPVGSHMGSGCAPVDVSLDGIEDLGGSMQEAIAEGGLPYADPCWAGPGLRVDPHCSDPMMRKGTVGRGGDWTAGRFLLASGLRIKMVMPSINAGFRCAYADSP